MKVLLKLLSAITVMQSLMTSLSCVTWEKCFNLPKLSSLHPRVGTTVPA